MKLVRYLTAAIAISAMHLPVMAQSSTTEWTSADQLEANLKKRYPATPFKDIKPSVLPGLHEVTMGKNIAYVDQSGRYFLFGRLFDMQTQQDLTPGVKKQNDPATFNKLPLNNSIKIKKGNGKRVFAVFSDPDCPYCKQLENTLSRMDNYTAYIFLMPLESIHPQAKAKAQGVWCSKDRAKAWHDWMLDAVVPSNQECKNPINENIALAESMEITGTPALIRADGTMAAGALPRADLEQWLDDMGATK